MVLATLCFIKRGGKTLMLHRVKKINDPQEGKWNVPGGKFEQGESPEDCVIREVKEESGLDIKDPVLKGVITFPAHDSYPEWIAFVFVATKFSGEQIVSNEGDLEWISDSKIMDLNLNAADKYFIPFLEKKGFFSAKMVYSGKEIISQTINHYE